MWPNSQFEFETHAKTYLFSEKFLKRYYFLSKKVEKHTIFSRGRGQVPPLALPCGRPCPAYIWGCKDYKAWRLFSYLYLYHHLPWPLSVSGNSSTDNSRFSLFDESSSTGVGVMSVRAVVNFINILRAVFVPILFCKNISKPDRN